MKYCTQCGNQAADNAKFCESCGTPFAAVQSASAAPSGNLPPMPSNRSAVPLPQPSGNVAPLVSAAPIQPPMPIPAAAGQPMDPAKKKKVIIAVVAVVVVLALAFVGIGVMTARANSMKLAGSSFFAKVDDKDEEITVSVGQDNTVTLSARDTYYDETTKIVGTLGKGRGERQHGRYVGRLFERRRLLLQNRSRGVSGWQLVGQDERRGNGR